MSARVRKSLTLRLISSLDRKSWAALGTFLALTLVAVPLLHLALPPDSAFHVSTYAITLLGKIMCYAIVAVAMDLIENGWQPVWCPARQNGADPAFSWPQ